jgi:flagellar FliL protein
MYKTLTTLFFIGFALFTTQIWAEEEEATPAKALYYKVAEPFTINFLQQSQQLVRYLQIRVAFMAHDQAVLDNAEMNLPMVQDALRTLFSEQSMQSVSSVDGRKALQSKTLETVNALLKEETGQGDIEAAYFTSFILQ